jgi:ABC-type microcin C transport system duplicated ATPase subunit YejF
MTDQLEIRDLEVSIGQKKILKGLSLTVKVGEVHALMGQQPGKTSRPTPDRASRLPVTPAASCGGLTCQADSTAAQAGFSPSITRAPSPA